MKKAVLIILSLFLISIISGCSGDKNTQKEKVEGPRKANLKNDVIPPGSAKIEAELIEIKKENKNYLAKVKFKKAIKYGMQTTQIVDDSDIMIIIPSGMYDAETFEEGKTLRFFIEQNGESNKNWLLKNAKILNDGGSE